MHPYLTEAEQQKVVAAVIHAGDRVSAARPRSSRLPRRRTMTGKFS
jgi:hypothetical protein